MGVELTRGERFKDARTVYNQHGKQTIAEVAAATGIAQGKLSHIETDKAGSIGSESVKRLAEHYGVSSDWLLGLSDIRTTNTDLKSVCEYTGLSESVIELLRRTTTIPEVINMLVAKYDGANITDVPLFKFAAAFHKVVRASIIGMSVVQTKAEDEAKQRETELGSALYQYLWACLDLPNSVLLSDETLKELGALSKDLEYKMLLALMTAQKIKEATHNGNHKED